jgi:hypothetical protein
VSSLFEQLAELCLLLLLLLYSSSSSTEQQQQPPSAPSSRALQGPPQAVFGESTHESPSPVRFSCSFVGHVLRRT